MLIINENYDNNIIIDMKIDIFILFFFILFLFFQH